VQLDAGGDLVVGDHRPLGRVPGAQHPDRHFAGIHRRDRRVERDLALGDRRAAPAAQGLEHLVAQEAGGRVLHPDVDRHGVTLLA
jgi:hypothetical protein